MNEKNAKVKPLLILNKDSDLFARMAKSSGLVDVRVAYKKLSFVMRVLRRIHIRMHLPLYSLWFSSIKPALASHDTIIMHATTVNPPIVEYVHKKFPDTRVIFWYWNPVSTTLRPDSIPDSYCEKWSFDERDSVLYKMNHNTQFYFKDMRLPDSIIKNDILFVGKDKGRYATILAYENEFERMGLSCDFSIMPTEERKIPLNSKYTNRIPYELLLDKISHSRAILDIVDPRQSGLTLRPMECIFFERKLITNLAGIKDYDFYDPNNIFILGEDKLQDLPKFIKAPYRKLDKDIVLKYDFSNWLERFRI